MYVQNEKNIVGKQIGNPKAEEEVATTRQQYPDLIDLTEMDYSPARKKPPIHN